MNLKIAAMPKSRYGQTKIMKQMRYNTDLVEKTPDWREVPMSMGPGEGMSRSLIEEFTEMPDKRKYESKP